MTQTPAALDIHTPDSPDPFAHLLCFSVYSTGLAINRIYKPHLDKLGLTYLQYLTILSLAQRDHQTVSELGGSLFLESSTLTPLLKRLEAAGLVLRRRDGRDERVVRLSLTEQGRDIAEQAQCIPLEILKATGLPVEDLSRLSAELKTLRETLRAADAKVG